MTMRLESKWSVGDRGAEYEFRVKLSMRVRGVKISDDELGMETEQAVELFADELRNDYPWVGRVGLTGRSGGWLLVEDAKGEATEDELSDINTRVDQARKDFETSIIESFGYEENGRGRVRELRYVYMGQIERPSRRGYRWTDGYSLDGNTYPWLTKREAQADAKSKVAEQSF